MRSTTSSGIRIFTPEIPDVGVIRIRYPVYPVHQEGNTIWKNLQALQDITMEPEKWSHMLEQKQVNQFEHIYCGRR